MNIQTSVSHPILYVFLIVILTFSISYTIHYYKKRKDEFSKGQRISLSIIKSLYVFIVSILLLAPLYEIIKNRIEKPILVVGVDNSKSILVDTTNAHYIRESINRLQTELENKYKVDIISFGDNVENNTDFSFDELRSDYSSFFTEANKRYYNLNVGAIVMFGDGIYNKGTNPEQHSSKINCPVYTVGIGDTSVYMDQAIVDITHNPNVFLENIFPIEVETNFTQFNQPSTQLSIYIDGKLKISEKIEIPQPDYYFKKTYELKAEEVGLKNILVVLSPVLNEQNTNNNRKRFTIEVHDNKKQILILSQGPHPDVGAIMQTLDNKANYNIIAENINGFNGDVLKYDLIVLNQLPSLRTQHLPVFGKIAKKAKAILAITGPQTSIAALNNLELGYRLKPTIITEESSPFFNTSFSLFSLPENIRNIEKIYPPLITHYTEYSHANNLSVLAYQKIKDIEMNIPLIIAGEIDNRKTAAIFGEGIWRWRIHEFQNFNNQDAFNQILVNLFNYLTIKDEHEQFRITYKRICSETEPVKFKAQVFNEIYEPYNNAEIYLHLYDSTNNELGYVFDANESNYSLNIGLLSPGNYHFSASTKAGDKEFKKSGIFNVQEVNIEQQNLQANFKTMQLIAQQSGGKFISKEKFDVLIDELITTPTIKEKIHKEKSIHNLIDIKWVIALILLLLSLEWFLRKFWGSY